MNHLDLITHDKYHDCHKLQLIILKSSRIKVFVEMNLHLFFLWIRLQELSSLLRLAPPPPPELPFDYLCYCFLLSLQASGTRMS